MTLKNDFLTQIATSNKEHNENPLLYHELKRALDNKEFFLLYQPIVDITEGRIISYEALIRWNHPAYGVISPSHFIPMAESLGLISVIDLWVLETVVSQDFNGIPVHVNVSACDLRHPGFLNQLRYLLENATVSIALEFTETAQIDLTPDLVKDIKELGLRLAVDDFGTGYSSMVLLNTLKVNTLKIDMQFVQNMLLDIDSTVITDAIIRLGNSLNIDVIAEGVETREQLLHLYRNGCRLIQGYLISPPLNFSQLNTFDASAFKLAPNEKYISDSNDLVQRYANNTHILLELDESLNYIRLTDNFCSYLGYTPEQLRESSFFRLIAPEQKTYFDFIVQRLKSSGYIDNVVLNLLRGDRSLKSTIFNARIESKMSRSIIVYLEDYTFYDEKLNAIHGVQNAYSVMFHEGPLATIVWDKNYEIIDWNSEATRVFGWTAYEAVGRNILKVVLPPDATAIPPAFEKVFQSPFAESVQKNLRQDGIIIVCRWVNRALRDAENNVQFVISMVTDITDYLLKNDNLRMLSSAMEKSGSAVVITDEHGEVEYSNQQFRTISGYSDGLIGQNINHISSHEHPKEYYITLWETISRGDTWNGTFHNRRQDGSFYWCNSVIVPVRSDVNNRLKFICLQEDVTRIQEHEAAMKQIRSAMEEKEKLSTLGAMLAGIIHEINTPLSIVTSNMQTLSDCFDEENRWTEDTKETAEDILRGLNHLRNLMHSFKAMASGARSQDIEYFDLHREIAMVLDVTRNEYKYDAFVDYKPGDPIMLRGNPGDLRQVVMNLLMNAVYSVKRKGHQSPGRITIRAEHRDGFAHFELEDNGTGVPPELITVIFEPFYTTKPSTEGSGLGLSICRQIIEERFSGTLSVDSNSDRTVFSFALPLNK